MNISLSPTVILVRPQMGENIGATARAMMNFGLHDLRIVAPRDGWPNAKAHEMSAHADSIIESAQLYATLSDALHNCHIALATSARRRDLPLPTYTAKEAGGYVRNVMQESSIRAAYIFGQENNGLANDDMVHCHGVITIPADPRNTSLNLAQCVMIVAYEWYNVEQSSSTIISTPISASLGEVDALYVRLCNALEVANYFSAPEKADMQRVHLRRILTQASFSRVDVHALHGVIKALVKIRKSS